MTADPIMPDDATPYIRTLEGRTATMVWIAPHSFANAEIVGRAVAGSSAPMSAKAKT